MLALKDILQRASVERWAVPHFNVSTLEMMRAIAEIAQEKKSPVLIGVSEGERKFIGVERAVMLIRDYSKECGGGLFINGDHTYSVELAREAIDAGFDSVHIDLSKFPREENIKGTKEVVEYAKAKNPGISIEGEIGYLVTDSSKIYDKEIEVPKDSLAKPEEAKHFIDETGVDRLAPAVGSLHGIAANKPKLDIDLISEIHALIPDTVLVLHGGSGVSDDDVTLAIKNGITNIHKSTDLRVAYARALEQSLRQGETTPYKFMTPAIDELKKIAGYYIDLFGSAGKV